MKIYINPGHGAPDPGAVNPVTGLQEKDVCFAVGNLAADYLRQFTYPWEALAGIKAEILRIGAALDPAEYTEVSEHVWVHKTATVAPTAYLGAPCIIGARTEARH